MDTRPRSFADVACYNLQSLLASATMTSTGTLTAEPPLATDDPTSADSIEVGSAYSRYWEGPIGMEGELTGDGRLIEPNALSWAVPFPLRYVGQDMGAHDGAVVVGRCLSVERRDGGVLWGRGDFDLGSGFGLEAQRQVGESLTNGVSMDLDDVSVEIRVAAELLEGDDLLMPMLMLATDSDEEITEDAEPDDPPEMEVDEDGRVTVMEMNADDEVRVTTQGRIRAATIVAIPAFASAVIHLTDDAVTLDEEGALVAASYPVDPPASWFASPGFTSPSPLTVFDDGRVMGHLATWDTCHTSFVMAGKCIQPPRNASGYAYFLTGALRTAEGTEVAVGQLTLDTTHAEEHLSAGAAMAHYSHTGKAVADVMCGEDAYGIWVAGALRPDVTPEQVRVLRASPLSGDWRRMVRGGVLELIGALAVNVQGFPIPRPKALVAGGHVQSLVASGMLAPRRTLVRHGRPVLSHDDLRYLKRLVDQERASTTERAQSLALRVKASSLRVRAHAHANTRH